MLTAVISDERFSFPTGSFMICPLFPLPPSPPGLEMAWVLRPPETVKSGEVFSVTYSVTVPDGFYAWAVQKRIFTHRFSTRCLLRSGWSGRSCSELRSRSLAPS